MSECHICSRAGVSYCSRCNKPVCRGHIEEEKEKGKQLVDICSVCIHKRKMKRLKILALGIGVVFATLILVEVIISYYGLWG